MNDQMLETVTKDYSSPGGRHGHFTHFKQLPPFHLFQHVPIMLRDPRINMALNYVKGTILSRARFFVDDGSPVESPSPVKQFLIRQIERWWRTSVMKQMRAIEWGFSGHEVIYCWKNGAYNFDHLKTIDNADCRAVTVDSELAGMQVHRGLKSKPRFIASGKSLWHVQGREFDPWYGRSRLFASYEPWVEMHEYGGAKDIRRKYFYKRAYHGDLMYHPPGSTPIDGVQVPNKQLAREALEYEATGGVLTLPHQTDQHGKRMWEVVSRDRASAANDVLQYCETLKEEESEGIGVPKELIEAADTGSGYSGRRIPMDAFHGMLMDPLTWLVADFDAQVLQTLARENWGLTESHWEIIPFGLIDEQTGEVGQNPEDPQVPDEAVKKSSTQLAA